MGQTNEILAKSLSEGLYSYVTEPVSLEETKIYMKIDDDITEDDTVIEELITTARRQLEHYTGLSFIPKWVVVKLKNECGGIEIPYGPVQSVIDPSLITDRDGNVIDLCIDGLDGFYYIDTRISWVQLIYGAGYGYDLELPDDLKLAIKALTFSLYQNRGEAWSQEAARAKEFACELAQPYSRVWDNMI